LGSAQVKCAMNGGNIQIVVSVGLLAHHLLLHHHLLGVHLGILGGIGSILNTDLTLNLEELHIEEALVLNETLDGEFKGAHLVREVEVSKAITVVHVVLILLYIECSM